MSQESAVASSVFEACRVATKDSAFDPGNDVSYSLRGLIHSETTIRSAHSRLVRSGFLFVILFEVGGVLGLHFPATVSLAKIVSFEIFNIVAGAVCLYITWTIWFHQHWRAMVFGFCAIIITSATYLSLFSGQTEPLFMSVILLLVGGGSLMPWNARWQGVLTFLCLSWFGVNAIWSPIGTATSLYQTLGLLAAGALAYSGSQLGARFRSELGKEIELLRVSQVRLRRELSHYVSRVEKSGVRIAHTDLDKLIAVPEDGLRRLCAVVQKKRSEAEAGAVEFTEAQTPERSVEQDNRADAETSRWKAQDGLAAHD